MSLMIKIWGRRVLQRELMSPAWGRWGLREGSELGCGDDIMGVEERYGITDMWELPG